MGYLHDGHKSLIQRAREENQYVIVSIFVNPTQFGQGEDFATYPRDLDADFKMINYEGVDILFYPNEEEVYPSGTNIGQLTRIVPPQHLTNVLCGKSRPGHFEGVCTVVAKLFQLVRPTNAYFGQKDAGQVAIIRKMTEDLNFPVNIIQCPIVRSSDGLAMSSRNTYLTSEERSAALVLKGALDLASDLFVNGERSARVFLERLRAHISAEKLAEIDYIDVVDENNLQPLETITTRALLALAVYIGTKEHRTRLIDNMILDVAQIDALGGGQV
jgi:pantoate--beta-alanine ligase